MSADSPSVISPARWRKPQAHMQSAVLTLNDQRIELRFPSSIEFDVRFLFPHGPDTTVTAHDAISIDEDPPGRFALRKSDKIASSNMTRVELLIWLLEEVTESLITHQKEALALHAAAVAWKGASIVVPGLSGAGKSSLAAWLVDRGFDYLSDEIALLTKDNNIVGFPRAVVVKSGAAEAVQGLSMFQEIPLVKCGEHLLFAPARAPDQEPAIPCGMLVFPRFSAGATLRIEGLTAAEAGLRLVECNLNARNFPDGGFSEITKFARRVPAISLEYGDFAQLEETLDAVLRIGVEKQFTAAELRQFAAAFSSPAPAQPISSPPKPIRSNRPRHAKNLSLNSRSVWRPMMTTTASISPSKRYGSTTLRSWLISNWW